MPRPPSSPPKPKRKPIPYPFIQDALTPLEPEIRPMFGAHAIYIGDKIVLMLRDSLKHPEDNGLWLVFSETAFAEDAPNLKTLRKEFPSIRKITLLGEVIQHWLLIPSDSPHFESDSMHATELVLAHDPRIGRIPESRKSKPKKKNPQTSTDNR
jgi:hypothetical protein